MSLPGPAEAALNNALWCDAVCRAHGRPGAFGPALWLNRHGTPRFYPDAVTLREDADVAPLLAMPRAGQSVKDSFARLRLEPDGFAPLFDATWIAAPPPSPAETSGWVQVRDPEGLAAWEAAWSDGGTAPRVFLPPLLDEPCIAIMGWMQDGAILGGGILNRGAGLVGLSNGFGGASDPLSVRRGLMAAAGRIFPGLGLVGYARGEPLAVALACGFIGIGALRVWAA